MQTQRICSYPLIPCRSHTASRFIDESGCPGFTLNYGSDPVFVIAMIVFENRADAAAAEEALTELRGVTRVRSEFKFSKCKDEVRDAFFRRMCKCSFSVRAVVVEKFRTSGAATPEANRDFCRFFTKEVLKGSTDELRNARIRIDGTGNDEFMHGLRRYLSAELQGRVRQLRMVDSARNPLMQLADMCVGAVARSYRDRPDARRWRAMLAPRIHEIREYK